MAEMQMYVNHILAWNKGNVINKICGYSIFTINKNLNNNSVYKQLQSAKKDNNQKKIEIEYWTIIEKFQYPMIYKSQKQINKLELHNFTNFLLNGFICENNVYLFHKTTKEEFLKNEIN